MQTGQFYATMLFVASTSIVSFIAMGFPFVMLFLLVCLDTLVIEKFVKMKAETGIELATFAVMVMAIVYGPWTALIFGFFIVPFITGILGLITAGLSPVDDMESTPFIPSLDNLIVGIAGFAAGFAYQQTSIMLLAAFIGLMVRTAFRTGKDMLTGDEPQLLGYAINTGLTMGLLFWLQGLMAHF